MLLAYLLVSLLGMAGSILVLALYAMIAFPHYCLMAKRLQDFNQPGKWAVAVIGLRLVASLLQFVEVLQSVGYGVSLLQLLVGLAILFVPGTAGSNDFGKQPGALVTA